MSQFLLPLFVLMMSLNACGNTKSALNNSLDNNSSSSNAVSEFTNLTVKLYLSKDTYSPNKNEEVYLSVILENHSGREITFTPGEKMENIKLFGQGENHRFPLKLNFYQLPENYSGKSIQLQNGESAEILKMNFKDIFEEHRQMRGRGRNARWIWDWDTATIAPPTPVMTNNTYESSAKLWAVVQSGILSFSSEKVILKVEK